MASKSSSPEVDTPAFSSAVVRKDSNTKKYLKLSGPQTFVKIHVGTGDMREVFTVQKSFLCHYSPFCDAAFNGPFVEGESQEMTLEDVEKDIFELLVRWIYEQKIWKEPNGAIKAVTLAKLWVLAERFLIPRLQNQICDRFDDPIVFDQELFPIDATGSARNSTQEFLRYVDKSATPDGLLRQYCLRFVLEIFNKKTHPSIPNERFKSLANKIFGPGTATEVIKAYIDSSEYLDIDLPEWNCKDFYVPE